MNNRTITIHKTFDAPVELVWEAWTQSAHIAQWWSPKGIETKVIEHNFNVGGKWKYIMPMPNGQEFIAEGKYTEIIEFEKIVSSANFKPMTEGVEIQALFRPNGIQTDFTFNVVHPTEAYKIQQEKMGIMNGWGSVFNRLSELLRNMQSINISNMKTMTCKQLGGACDLEFHAETFEEIAEISKKHGMEMFQKGDKPHLKAMGEMQELMKTPRNMQEWFANKKSEFEAL